MDIGEGQSFELSNDLRKEVSYLLDDNEIVRLFTARDENALKAVSEKYRVYCMKIAENITGSFEDAEECVNDALMSAWESIPPNKPELLSTYLGKLTRNLAINRRKARLTEKRGGGECELAYEELSEMIGGAEDVSQALDRRELTADINRFLKGLSERKRAMFIRRYWFCESVKTIADELGASQSSVSVTLHRLREKLRTYLRKRGYDI